MDWVIAGSIEVASKGKTMLKVAPSVLASLVRPPFEMLANVVEGLIEGVCEYKVLLSKQFADNWN